LFDSYKFVIVELEWIPSYKNTTPSQPDVLEYYAVDYDSQAAPASADDVRQFATCKYRLGSQRTRLTIYPKFLTGVYEGSSGVGASKQDNGWLDLADKDIPHYGLLTYMTYPTTIANVHQYTLNAHYTVLFKQRR